MSYNTDWDVNNYREEHESDEHWSLRRDFMLRWKNNYSEERLVCLARVFANIELMGCRYPMEVMQEVAQLSKEVTCLQKYRHDKKTKLQRTFISASNAAEDRAKGVKREGASLVGPPQKFGRIDFVKSSNEINFTRDDDEKEQVQVHQKQNFPSEHINLTEQNSDTISNDIPMSILKNEQPITDEMELKKMDNINIMQYIEEFQQINCIDVRRFRESMLDTPYGRFVLLIRPESKLRNIQYSCQVCKIPFTTEYKEGCFRLLIGDKELAVGYSNVKISAKRNAENAAWNKLRDRVISVVIKESWIAHGGDKISMDDVAAPDRDNQFGTPIETGVATKMMKLMGWKGGGLGADQQGIAEPIKPQMQMINRAGLGSFTTDIRQLRRAAILLMKRYRDSETIDVDLVFNNQFTKEERAILHEAANRCGLVSRSYGKDAERFLVVRKRFEPFSLVRAIIEKGGETPKYLMFIPSALDNR